MNFVLNNDGNVRANIMIFLRVWGFTICLMNPIEEMIITYYCDRFQLVDINGLGLKSDNCWLGLLSLDSLHHIKIIEYLVLRNIAHCPKVINLRWCSKRLCTIYFSSQKVKDPWSLKLDTGQTFRQGYATERKGPLWPWSTYCACSEKIFCPDIMYIRKDASNQVLGG